MLSEYGKFTRKLRIDNGELLKDMAIKLGVTTSYLSAVEVGKRNIPDSWRDLIINEYNLSDDQIKEMDEAIYNSQKVIKLKLDSYSDPDRDLILSFARKFNELDEDEKKDIWNTLNK